MCRRVLLTAAIAVAAAIVLATPGSAAYPQGKQFTIDLLGVHINSPVDAFFIGFDCVTFFNNGVACFPGAFADCGTYTLDQVGTTRTDLTIDLNSNIVGLFTGPMTLKCSAERAGAGGALACTGVGNFRGFPGPRTRTNLSLHALEGCPAPPRPVERPADNWQKHR